MTRITIDLSRCIGCGACVKDCLMANLKLEGGTVTAGERCILCGHCVAVCPKNAVSLSGCAMGETEEYDPETFTVEPGQFLHAVKFRRSIRQFQKTMVSDEARDRILETGRYTATAANRQDNRLIWVQKELDELKETLWEELPDVIPLFEKEAPAMAARFSEFSKAHAADGKDSLFFGAPVLLAIQGQSELDAGLAAANMEMMAVCEGCGVLYSCYLTRIINRSPVLREWLELEDRDLSICMLIGYPAVRYFRTAPRKEAKQVVIR